MSHIKSLHYTVITFLYSIFEGLVQYVGMGAVFDGANAEVLPAQLPDKVCYEGSFPGARLADYLVGLHLSRLSKRAGRKTARFTVQTEPAVGQFGKIPSRGPFSGHEPGENQIENSGSVV